MKRIINIILSLFIVIEFSKAEQLDFVGYISCLSKKGTIKSKYAILETNKILSTSSSLNVIFQQLEKKYLITQTVKGSCSISDNLEIYLTKPVMALELLNALIRIYGFQYYVEGNILYKPVYLLMYQTSISFQRLFSLIREKIITTNKNLIVEWVPESKTVIIADKNSNIFADVKKTKTEEKGCIQEELVNYVDLCKVDKCIRFSLYTKEIVPNTMVVSETYKGFVKSFSMMIFSSLIKKLKLKPYFICKEGRKVIFESKNTCGNNVLIKTLYLDKIDLKDVLKIFEKLFNIQFTYDLVDISQVKNSRNLHLVFKCLTKQKAIEFLQKNFHLYIEQIAPNVYRIFADRDSYSLALRKVSNLVTKVFYIKNIPLREFIKLLEIYYRNKMVYSADPEFNAVTVIATKETIESIVKRFGIYIRDSEVSDRLMSKIYYVKYGKIEDLVKRIEQYRSEKGLIKVLKEARAIEITDYPTNLAMIEKIFSKFLSQKPIKIKVTVKFINIEKNFARSLGINWDATYTGNLVTESVQSINIAQNTGSLSVTASFIYRKLNPLSISISAAETIGLAKTLSSPSLILLNGQQGTISQGVQIPYQAVDQNGNPTTNLVQATLTLNVEPLLLPDGRILLKLNLSNNSPNTALSVNGQPAINTFTIQQDFIVPNGGTIVIGGVLQKKIDNGETGVPILRKIPLLGWLFKTKNWSKQDSELYVIVTAKVISD